MCQTEKVEFTLKKTLKTDVAIARLHQNKCFHHHGVILHELVSTKASVRTLYLLHTYDAPTQHFNYSFKTGYKPTSSCRYFIFQLLRNSPDSNASIWNAKREKSVENHQNVSSILQVLPLNMCSTVLFMGEWRIYTDDLFMLG